ncbi:Concanavalin a-like lectin/glucanase, subgroup, partial [Globisporangium splendens]
MNDAVQKNEQYASCPNIEFQSARESVTCLRIQLALATPHTSRGVGLCSAVTLFLFLSFFFHTHGKPSATKRNPSAPLTLPCIPAFPVDGMRTKMRQETAAVLALSLLSTTHSVHGTMFNAKSGLKPWVDVHTPQDAYTATSSRGATWDLVFSDEFNVAGRNFAAGNDYLWTALDLPDGVNAALEYYSPNMSSTVTEPDGRGVFQIEVRQESNISFTVYNAYTRPPQYESHSMYYRSAMVQSWNKFCFQGGLMEVSTKLPGAISSASGNPDLGNKYARVKNIAYYPTWPGIWLLGNLARALFTKSTNRMWPWSYNECNEELAPMQRISACDSNPGYGLNKNQGRGAPEIDLLEGGGTDVSTSIQLAPGMPDEFRMIPATSLDSTLYCFYSGNCKTPGANFPGIPTAVYDARGHKSWYQGLKYTPNTLCTPVASQIQNPAAVIASVKKGITDNTCSTVNVCPASRDGGSSLDRLDNTTRYWGVNDKGGCMPVINGYQGSYLCDPDNSNKKCADPLTAATSKSNVMSSFNYQMDAISANSGLPLAAYTDYLRYQVEWVTGSQGYVRWLVEGIPIFEIPAESMENPPQDSKKSNPKKVMIEEPMYIIFNVALSTSWGSKPPNPGKPCKGDGKDATVNKICDEFPMYMKIDYIRLYQDTSKSSKMTIGCDPATHPTKKWIEGHIEEYQDVKNPIVDVVGGASCKTDDDCTVSTVAAAAIVTGQCKRGVCSCLSSGAWGGPRCTLAVSDTAAAKGFGPSIELALIFAAIAVALFLFVMYKIVVSRRNKKMLESMAVPKSAARFDVEIDDVTQSHNPHQITTTS